jgi:hypothetical protein
LVGQHSGDVGDRCTNDLFIIDQMEGKWEQIKFDEEECSIPRPRMHHAHSLYDGNLVIFGGGDWATTGETDNLPQAQSIDDIKSPVASPPAKTGDDRVPRLVIDSGEESKQESKKGSSNGAPDSSMFGDVWLFNMELRKWAQLEISEEDGPGRCVGATLANVQGHLLLFGGRNKEGRMNDVWELNFTEKKWERIVLEDGSPAPAPRNHHGCVSRDRTFVIFGGHDGESARGDMWCFDIRNQSINQSIRLCINP